MHEWHVGTGEHAIPLLASKLAVPPPPEVPLARPRLTRLLDAGVRGPVTLVTAPAGWGKTVLLGAWARAQPDQPVAWYTAEAGDGPRFWAYVGAALRKHGVDAPEDADPERLAAAIARLERPAVLLLDDLHLAVDQELADGLDFLVRHADRRLHLVAAVRTEPPLGLHRWRLEGGLVEVSAHDLAFNREETAELLARHRVPASARRVDDLQLRTEGWPAGLRFAARSLYAHPDPDRFIAGYGGEHPSVAGYLVDEVLAGQPAEARDVLLRTSIAEPVSGELADVLTGREDAARVLAELERTNGFVMPLKSRPGAYRYHRMFGELLRAELRRRSPDQLTDLHRRAAAWHADRHMPPDALRHALAGRDWPRATELLVQSWPELIPYGPEGDRLPAPPIPPPPASALRADPALALAYAAAFLDAQDRTSATAFLRLAQRHRDRMPQGQRARYALVAAALRLAEAQLYGDHAAVLPAARQLLDLSATAGVGAAAARPLAATAGTAAGGRNGGPGATAAAPLIRNAGPVTPGTGPVPASTLARNSGGNGTATGVGPTATVQAGQNAGPHGPASVSVRNGGPGNGHGELSPFGRAGDGAAGAGERAFRAADPATRAVALAAVGVAEMEAGDLVAAGYALAAGLAEARAAGLTRPASACAARLAVVHAVRGELREAGEAARAYQGGSSGDRRHAHLALALVALHRDELAEAAAHLDRAAPPAPADAGVPSAERAGTAFPALVAVARAGLLEARGDLAAAHRAISAARADRALPPLVERWLAVAEADLHTARGDASGARVLLGPVAAREDAAGQRTAGDVAGAVALARAQLRAGDPAAATRALPPWDDLEADVPPAVRVDAGLLSAIAARRGGDHRRAARDLEAVLGLAGPEGFRRVFTRGGTDARDLLAAHLDAGTAYWPLVADLVAAMPPPAAADPPPSPETGETLTERELTVLRYLQSMLSTVEIAGELSLSVNTVKTHVRNIYRKLSATRRREAVRRGRELRLI
ncbi:LuxR C-terminal-related transcriptional regulator [Phytohabitans sp. ZYX-F-186]|uniref:LuxR C-terminal-related transcriptional regulator n=1 Tax=Phytohabitans maris TaxID=3071409 RepID=A0ABU0ZV92_9ACTN|nr:LuxR C-terminal-related transcriptional regulator [Phytohabitans sp. ZYX-F-186]MDQ7910701.1 LuxR C-terminal-related transcriptional regulator [Phytohabitans sp. ZYX-F-186]